MSNEDIYHYYMEHQMDCERDNERVNPNECSISDLQSEDQSDQTSLLTRYINNNS